MTGLIEFLKEQGILPKEMDFIGEELVKIPIVISPGPPIKGKAAWGRGDDCKHIWIYNLNQYQPRYDYKEKHDEKALQLSITPENKSYWTKLFPDVIYCTREIQCFSLQEVKTALETFNYIKPEIVTQ